MGSMHKICFQALFEKAVMSACREEISCNRLTKNTLRCNFISTFMISQEDMMLKIFEKPGVNFSHNRLERTDAAVCCRSCRKQTFGLQNKSALFGERISVFLK